jgi:hypothetical protein
MQVYEEALQSEQCEAVHLTRVLRDDVQCDTFLPPLDPKVGVAPRPLAPRLATTVVRFPRADGRHRCFSSPNREVAAGVAGGSAQEDSAAMTEPVTTPFVRLGTVGGQDAALSC